jgi:aryl-alcohol dehydrogenase-like predicted oxidoreductase
VRTIHLSQLQRDLACLGLGVTPFQRGEEQKAFAIADAFVRLGGSLIDTAEIYGGGDCERLLGKWVAARGNRGDVVIMDKGCHYPAREVSPTAIHESIAGALERLGTDYLDIWAFHRDNPQVPVGPLMEALNEEVARGRIRAFGGSNWTAARIREANQYAQDHGLMGMALASPQVCLAKTREPFWVGCLTASEEDLAWYAQAGVVVVAWSSQGQGFFRDESAPDNLADQQLAESYHTPENFEKLRRAREVAKRRGVSAVQIALAYVLNLPAPIIALVGPNSVEELASSAAAVDLHLTPAEMDWLALRTDGP